MTPIGKNQLRLLRQLGPHLMLVVGDKLSASMVKRGLLQSAASDGDAFFHLSPNGLRALADAIDAGLVEPLQLPKKDTGDSGSTNRSTATEREPKRPAP